MITLQDLLRGTISQLAEAGIDTPQLDARLIITHAAQLNRHEWLTPRDRLITEQEHATVRDLITRRCQHAPIGRLLGEREFWSLPFRLNEATLEPRPDSETLVDNVLKILTTRNTPPTILDLGTGTGCLILALLHELPNARGVGIDLSPRALEQATENAHLLGLANRCHFQHGDWATTIDERFDCIISNPPYIPSHDIPNLMRGVRDYDPLLALDGGVDGLTPYRIILQQAPNILQPNGVVAFEVGFGQAPDVRHMMIEQGFRNITTHNDLGGVERCVIGFWMPDKQS